MNIDNRTCANEKCKKPLVMRLGENKYNFERRVSCGVSCGAQSRLQEADRKNKPELANKKPCKWCSKKIKRRATESFRAFLKRAHCSNQCASRTRVRKTRLVKQKKSLKKLSNVMANMIPNLSGKVVVYK